MTFPFVIGASQQKRSGRPFIIKVNYASGFTVTLPLYNAGGYNYNFIVDWGDGAVSQVISATDANRIHTYASGGTYTITMTGTLEGFIPGNIGPAGLREYLISIEQWGRTGFKFVRFGSGYDATSCTRLVYCKGKLTTSQTDFNYLFNRCISLVSCDVSEWDVSKITNFGAPNDGMFGLCPSLLTLDVSNWVFSTVSNISFAFVFYGCTKLNGLDTSNWNTENFTSLAGAFSYCTSLTSIDVSGWNVQKCTVFGTYGGGTARGCFAGCTGLTSIDVSGWQFSTTSNVDLQCLFLNCSNLTSLDVSGWNTGKIINMSYVFQSCSKLTSIDVSGWDVSSCTNFRAMCSNCTGLTSIDVSNWVFSSTSNINFSQVFLLCSNLVTLDVSGWNTGKFASMGGAFYRCSKLTSLVVTNWNVTNCTDFAETFQGTSSTTLDVGSWVFNSTSNINMYATFSGCTGLTSIDVSGWNTSKIINFANAFYNCSSLTSLNCSNWNVSSCTNFASMFSGCYGLTSLNVSGWTLNTTTNVTMGGMFYNCKGLTSISFTGWNTSKVTNFQQFLDNCLLLATCDVSVLSTAAATNVSYMFRSCRSMTAIDISGWDLSLVTAANMTHNMFYGCYGLTSLTLPASLSRVDNQFAVFTGTPACTRYDIYRATAPTVSGTPFGNYAKPLHVPVSNSGYNVAPWTNTAIFSSIINDL